MSRSDAGRRGGRRAGTAAAIVLLAALATLPVPLRASSRDAVPAGVVPGDGFAAGWKKSGPMRTFIGQDLFNHIDGGAELFLEFGFDRVFVQAYGDGRSELTASIYVMSGATSALGVYLMKMGRETPFTEIAARNSSEESQTTIVKGRYFVQVDNFSDVPAARPALAALANAVLALVPDEKAEQVLDRLPVADRVPGTERLIRGPVGFQPYYTLGEGDILGLKGEIFAALAEYAGKDGSRSIRLIVPYPDRTAAEAALDSVRKGLDPYLKPVSKRPSGLTFVDFQKKYGRIDLEGNVLDIRLKLAGPDD